LKTIPEHQILIELKVTFYTTSGEAFYD